MNLKEFWETEAIPLLDFEVIPAHFTFLSTVSIPYLHCDEFLKSFIKLFLRMIIFQKSSLSFMLLRFLCCMCLFASLEEI